MNMLIKGAALLAVLGLLAGCATSRDVVSLTDAPVALPATTAATTSTTTQAASQAVAIKLVGIDDQRIFSIDPRDPSQPSLKDDAISDKSITSRAFARKRSGYGMALGDILLPPGDTVSAHIGRAVADGFRQAGYRVLESGDAGYDQAVPVSVVVKQYWLWDAPGWSLAVNCIAELRLDSNLPALAPSQTVSAQAKDSYQIVVDSDWVKVAQAGLQDISAKVAALLKSRTQSAAGS